MVQGEEVMSRWTGLEVYLPNGRKLGTVHDAVIDAESMHCTHLFVRDTPEDLVEGPKTPKPRIVMDQINLMKFKWKFGKGIKHN